MEDLQKSTKQRLLTVTEVGAGLMKSLQYDQDGACYIVFPDCPLIDYPINQTLEFIGVVLIAKRISGHFGVELFTYKHLLGILKKALSYLRMNGGLVIYSLYRCNLSELLD